VNVSKGTAGDDVDGEMEYDKNVYNLLDELPFRKKMKAHADADSESGDKTNA
jgi:predicted GTPase